MGLLEKFIRSKLDKVMEDEKKYSFPRFLVKAREASGLSRREVGEIVKASNHRIYQMELGNYLNHVDEHLLESLAKLYFLDPRFLKMKYIEHMNAKKRN